jgi:hypothetical protein
MFTYKDPTDGGAYYPFGIYIDISENIYLASSNPVNQRWEVSKFLIQAPPVTP